MLMAIMPVIDLAEVQIIKTIRLIREAKKQYDQIRDRSRK